MKTALITTTVNIPRVLELYRAHSEDVRFFVALEPSKQPVGLCDYIDSIDNARWIHGDEYKCSELIGWNTIARRNIAMLEALKWGADIVVTVDDDNIPIDPFYFEAFERALDWRKVLAPRYGSRLFDGIQASSESGWFDVGTLLDPIAPHRGFPHVKAAASTYSHCTKRKVGVAAGICLGDPDVSATTRIARAPVVHRVSELLRAGIVVDPAGERRPERERVTDELGTVEIWRTVSRGTWTVFNSQNTAIIRELAPAFFMVPQWGRYDDIFASLVVQRIMRERGFVTHFGMPYVWQSRNQHDLLSDLKAEQFGAERILDFAQWLDGFVFTGNEKVSDQMRIMFTNLLDWMPERSKIQEMVLAWSEDCDQAAPTGSEL
jgi:hypothetical protein